MTEPRRVEVPACSRAWMQGDRYGVAVSYNSSTDRTRVKLDKSGRIVSFPDVDLIYLED